MFLVDQNVGGVPSAVNSAAEKAYRHMCAGAPAEIRVFFLFFFVLVCTWYNFPGSRVFRPNDYFM